jgi:hypothetical protein
LARCDEPPLNRTFSCLSAGKSMFSFPPAPTGHRQMSFVSSPQAHKRADPEMAQYNMRAPTQARERRWDTRDLEWTQRLAALTPARRGANSSDRRLWLRSCQHQRHLAPSSLASPTWEHRLTPS